MPRPAYRGSVLSTGGGSGTVGGGTGSTDRAALRASGAGGVTAQGSDLLIGDAAGGLLPLSSAGGNVIALQPVAGISALQLGTVASGVNYATITPGATGSPVVLGSAGADAAVGISLAPKGAGNVLIASGTVQLGGTTSSYGGIYAGGTTGGMVWILDAVGNPGGTKSSSIRVQSGSFSSTQETVRLDSNGGGRVEIASGGQTAWSSTSVAGAAPDAGFKRAAAAVVQPTNGSSGFGQLRFDGSTGAGTPLLGSNCPASSLTSPYSWLKIQAQDGTPCVIPAYAV